MAFAISFCSAVTPDKATNPVMPFPINAGVLGIVRTMDLCPCNHRDKSSARIPAAIDITN